MCQNPEIFRILELFSDLKYPLISTSKCHEKCRRFCRLGAHTDPDSYGRKNPRHFAWPVRVLTSGISQFEKSVGILRYPGFWHFFQICKIPLVSTLTGCAKCCPFCHLGALTDICTVTVQIKKVLRHFACQFRVLKSGILQIWKKCQNPDIPRIQYAANLRSVRC
jgi:hypothetical protein